MSSSVRKHCFYLKILPYIKHVISYLLWYLRDYGVHAINRQRENVGEDLSFMQNVDTSLITFLVT